MVLNSLIVREFRIEYKISCGVYTYTYARARAYTHVGFRMAKRMKNRSAADTRARDLVLSIGFNGYRSIHL